MRTLDRLQVAVKAPVFRAAMSLPAPLMRLLAGRPVERDGLRLSTQQQWLLRMQRLAREPAVETLPWAEARAAMLRQAVLAGGRQRVGSVRDLRVPGPDGPVPARLYVPRDHSFALVVFFHGGAMVYGDLDSHDALCRFLAEKAGVRVLAVDYRLAPEHPFPAGLEDAWAAFEWAVGHAGELGADPARVAVAGDSAGGYLSAAVALRAAEEQVPLAFQLLLYPVTDMRSGGATASRRTFSTGFYLTEQFIEQGVAAYLSGADPTDPRASVLLAEIPDGLAPAFVVTGGFDPLRDEGEAYVRRLREAGVPVRHHRYDGLIHGFVNLVGVRGDARQAMEEIATGLRAGVTPAAAATGSRV